MMLMSLERHVPVFLWHEPHQSLTVASTLRRKAQSYATPAENKRLDAILSSLFKKIWSKPFDYIHINLSCLEIHLFVFY